MGAGAAGALDAEDGAAEAGGASCCPLRGAFPAAGTGGFTCVGGRAGAGVAGASAAGSGCVVAGFVPPPSAGGVVPSLAGGPCGSGACASAEGLGSDPFPCNGSWSGVAVGAAGCVAVAGTAAEPRCPTAYPSPKHSPHSSKRPRMTPTCAPVLSVSSVSCPRAFPRLGTCFWGSSPAASSSSKYPRVKVSPRKNVPTSKYPVVVQLYRNNFFRSRTPQGCF
jgi:hypothetical protein